MVILPAGRAASPETKGGVPVEFHWKTFAARMIIDTQAAVLPIFVHGHPGPLANPGRRKGPLADNIGMVKMFYGLHGRDFRVSVGEIHPFSTLENQEDRHKLTLELRDMVFGMSDGVEAGDIDPGSRPI